MLHQAVSAFINNQSPNTIQMWKSGARKKYSILLLQKPAAISLLSGVFDETWRFYTSKKRSFDVTEYKKQRCLNIWKFTRTVSSFTLN